MGKEVERVADSVGLGGVVRTFDKVISEVASWVGIEGHYETVANIGFTSLVTPGLRDDQMRRVAKRKAWGDLKTYSDIYMSSQRAYKTTYSTSMLLHLGYNPSVTATASVLDGPAILDYLQVNDPSATALKAYKVQYISAETAAYDWMEDNIGWSNISRKAITGGKTWVNLLVTDDQVDITMDFVQLPEDNIVEDLTANYSYDSNASTVLIDEGPYSITLTGTSTLDSTNVRVTIDTVDLLSFATTSLTPWTVDTQALASDTYTIDVYDTVSGVETLTETYTIDVDTLELYYVNGINFTDNDGFYSTTVTQVADGVTTVTIDTAIVTATWSISSAANDSQKLVMEYFRDSSEYYHYIRNTVDVPSNLYTSATIEVTAIVPLKEEGVIVDLGNRNLGRMLRKMGFESDSFEDSLNNADIDAAYLLNGLPADTTSAPGMKTMFNMFDLMSPGSDSVNISIADLKMGYSFKIVKTAGAALIQPVGTYTNTLITTTTEYEGGTSETTYRRELIYQGNATEYRKLVITDFQLTYTLSGQQVVSDFGDSRDRLRLIIPIDIFRRLRYRDWVDVYEQSIVMLTYTEELVYHRWTESGIVSFIGYIIAAVAMYFGQVWLTIAIMSAMYAIDYLVRVGIISGKIGLYLKAVVAIVAMAFGNFNSMLDIVLVVVNTATTLAQTYLSLEQMELLEEMEAWETDLDANVKKLVEASDTWRDETKEDLGFMLFDMNIANTYPVEDSSTELMVFRDIEYVIEQPNMLFEITAPLQDKLEVKVGHRPS